ncbi:MAG TPA: hypothetical protein VLT83_09695 [Opitutaceae bacterium]|nr:hypothetical protein [Opitutaceae bacterium]
MRRCQQAVLQGLATIGSILALSGCVSAKYQLARKATPPASPLQLNAAQASVEATVGAVIVYDGPGSWKRKAYWDEYVLTIANRGGAPVIVGSAALVDSQGNQISSGSDPWQLEQEGKTWWQNVKSSEGGRLVTLGVGTAAAGTAFVAVGATALTSASAGIAAGAATLGLAAVALPVYAVATVAGNAKGRHKIEAEFSRRRLALPAKLAPGQTVRGSLFFRVTPGPARLLLHCRGDAGALEVAIDLAPLAGLHFKDQHAPPPVPPAPAPAPLAGS